MSKLKDYLAELAACHQAAAATIMELYRQRDMEVLPTDQGVQLIWRGAHVLHQEFGSTEEMPAPTKTWVDPELWRLICLSAYRQNKKRG